MKQNGRSLRSKTVKRQNSDKAREKEVKRWIYVVHFSLQWREDPFEHSRPPRPNFSTGVEAAQHGVVEVVLLKLQQRS